MWIVLQFLQRSLNGFQTPLLIVYHKTYLNWNYNHNILNHILMEKNLFFFFVVLSSCAFCFNPLTRTICFRNHLFMDLISDINGLVFYCVTQMKWKVYCVVVVLCLLIWNYFNLNFLKTQTMVYCCKSKTLT